MKRQPVQALTSLRIIGGRWRSRRLQFHAVDKLRPTANRIRETLFNWLQDRIEGENCLDLFAGSGACGMEALSRGAAQVVFVEHHPLAVSDIRRNLGRLEAVNARVEQADVMTWLTGQGRQSGLRFGIVFIDPPYADHLVVPCSVRLEEAGLLTDDALVYVESDQPIDAEQLPDNWRVHRHKKAGVVHYYLLQRTARPAVS